MDRRSFLKTAAGTGVMAATGGLAMPALSQGAAAKTLRFVPQANLANFDPIWGTQYVVRNAAALVWDTLYGIDSKFQPQRQMVEGEEVSSDGLTWTFKLRSGLKFHDGTPVLAKDVVQSLKRWQARDPMGLMIKAIENELVSRRRSDLDVEAEAALPEDAAGARQEQCAVLLHHARAHRQDRSVHADHRICRLRADEVRPQ
jgi:peptide/nickel transport system substrate-binding protein